MVQNNLPHKNRNEHIQRQFTNKLFPKIQDVQTLTKNTTRLKVFVEVMKFLVRVSATLCFVYHTRYMLTEHNTSLLEYFAAWLEQTVVRNWKKIE